MTLNPRVDRIGWVIITVALLCIFVGVGYDFFTFPKHSVWSGAFLAVGGLLAIVIAVHQANRLKRIQKRNPS